MNDKKFQRYAYDSIASLKEQAKKAKLETGNPKEGEESYHNGHLMGYYGVISLLKHEAWVFNIDEKDLGLDDMEPDRDLLGLLRREDIESEGE